MWITLFNIKENKHTNPFEVERIAAWLGEFYFVCKEKYLDMLTDFCKDKVLFEVWEKVEVIKCTFRNSEDWAFTAVPYDETARNI